MGSVIQLKNKVNNAYLDLKNSVDDKIILVEEKIKDALSSYGKNLGVTFQIADDTLAVSYTHLTLPTIYSV